MNTIKHIKLGFETSVSSEKLTVNTENADVKYINIMNIERNIVTKDDCSYEIKSSKYIKIILNNSANQKFRDFINKTLFERIESFKDISYLVLYYNDGTSETIFVNWHPDSDEENINEKVTITEDSLEIVIN